jgi:hypothetical protein
MYTGTISMKHIFIYILAYAITVSACEQRRINASDIQKHTCAESQALRISFREKFDALRGIEPELRTEINTAIRTAPITELDDLFDLINDMYNEQQHQ